MNQEERDELRRIFENVLVRVLDERGLVKKAAVAKSQWWASNEGIQTKAAELGITPRGGESWMDLKARVTKQLESVAPF